MPLTVRDLVATPDLGLRLLTQGADVDRPITWVHVSELDDPTPFLSGGELLLTTGIADGSGATGGPDKLAETDDYVRRLGSADVVGLGFGTGLSHAQVPDSLLQAAARHGLPIVEVPRATPFIAISRAVSRSIAADEYAAVTRTFTAQQALTKAALAESGPDRLVRLLARQMAGWVVLLDPNGSVLAEFPAGPPPRTLALASEVGKVAGYRGAVGAGFSLGDDLVSLLSVGAGGRGRAYLAVGRPGPLTTADRHLVNAAVMLLTISMEQPPSVAAAMSDLRSAVLLLLFDGRPETARSIAAQLSVPLPAEPVCVLVAVGNQDVLAAASSPDRPFTAELDDALITVVEGDPDEAARLADRMVATDRDGIAVGISSPAPDTGIGLAYRQAKQAAAFAARSPRRVASFDEIAMTGISGLIDTERADAFAQSLLAPLIDHDRAGRGDLLNSLREWLAHHGQWEPAAAALGVHRHTLRSRMSTVGRLIGRDLDSPGTRGELWLALEMLAR